MKEKVIEFLKKYNIVACSLALTSKDNNTEYVNYGKKKLTSKEEVNEHSIYRIASISKVIVAIGLLKLYEKNIVDIDEDISNYLGFVVRNPKYINDKITLRMVMSQTSSICDDIYDNANCTDDYIPLKQILTNPKSFTLDKPGVNFMYSNLGCGILACVIERMTNTYFPTYIVNEVLKPLGIESGFRIENLKYPDRLVSHYLYNKKENKFHLYRNLEKFQNNQCLIYPLGDNYRGVAGGLYISTFDLNKIMIMLKDGGKYQKVRILSETTVREMENAQWIYNNKYTRNDPTYYKKGLQMIILDEFTKEPLHGHFGNAYGLRAFMLYNQNGGMIFLCSGADFITDEEHMTILQKDLITFLSKEMSL